MKQVCIVITLAVLSVLAACKGGGTAAFNEEEIELRYAKLLTLKQGDGYVAAEVTDPWRDNAVLHRYVLVPRDAEVPEGLPQGELIRTPLQKAVGTHQSD